MYTDHLLLRGIKTKKDITRRLTRMILGLQEYSFQLLYIPGKLNVVSDAMTRGPFAEYIMACNAMIEEENTPVDQINATDIMIVCNIELEKKVRKEIKIEPLKEKEKKRARKWFKHMDDLTNCF